MEKFFDEKFYSYIDRINELLESEDVLEISNFLEELHDAASDFHCKVQGIA